MVQICRLIWICSGCISYKVHFYLEASYLVQMQTADSLEHAFLRSCNMRKYTLWHHCQAKTWISLPVLCYPQSIQQRSESFHLLHVIWYIFQMWIILLVSVPCTFVQAHISLWWTCTNGTYMPRHSSFSTVHGIIYVISLKVRLACNFHCMSIV